MKKAFTMIEIIFVISVIGILAAVVIPRTGSNKLNEAAIQVVSHIRYTQHLAVIDDKFNGSDSIWFKRRWQIIFGNSAYTDYKPAYTIFSDTSGTASGKPDKSEIAKNPLDSSKILSGGHSGTINFTDPDDKKIATKEMNLGATYGIDSYLLTGGCSGARVAFDHLGRPISGDLSSTTTSYHAGRLIKERCNVILTNDEGSITIAIEPESGYAHILH
jgi:prepilin-type N-terminal cleavage/methylation domain-containing protein